MKTEYSTMRKERFVSEPAYRERAALLRQSIRARETESPA